MKRLQNALVRAFGFLRYIGFEFVAEEDGFVFRLRPSEEEEWHTDALTEIHVTRDGFYSEMTFYVDKTDVEEEEIFLFANKYNEGPCPVKLHIADADDSYAVVGTLPNYAGVDPEYEFSFDLSEEDAEAFADEVQLSAYYLKGYMDTVLSDFTGFSYEYEDGSETA